MNPKIESIIKNKGEEVFSVSEHKKNIKQVFELNPELVTIGSEDKYLEHLQAIFPESKYKEIAYKGVSDNFTNENKPSFYTKDLEGAKYYANLREGTKTISAVFNFKNPLVINAERPAPIPITTPDGQILGTFNDKDINEKIIQAGYDGLILNRKFSSPLDGWEILSLNGDSRYILATDFDKEKFKEFVSKE